MSDAFETAKVLARLHEQAASANALTRWLARLGLWLGGVSDRLRLFRLHLEERIREAEREDNEL